MAFDNINRTRYYGLRIGDIVTRNFVINKEYEYRVSAYAMSDNNAVYLSNGLEKPFKVVAEHCTIVRKVEDNK